MFELLKSLLLCQCPFEDNFRICLSQLIQWPDYVTKSEYELLIKIQQTKKKFQFMSVLSNGSIFEDLYHVSIGVNSCRVDYIPQIFDVGHRK